MKFLSLKNVLLAVVAVILGAFCVFAYQSGNSKSVDEKYYRPQGTKKEYNAQKEAGEAWHKFHLGVAPAGVINRIPTGEKVCALVFAGLPQQEDMGGILEAMHQHNAKGTFFVEGSNGAGDPEALKAIVQRGQKIGNFGYVGLPHMEALPIEKIINEFVGTQKICKKF